MAVAQITPHLTSLQAPEAIRALPAWVMWRFEPNDNPGGKPRKVPYYVNGSRRVGQQGTPKDKGQLVTFDAARNAAARRGFDGVGFCPLPEFGIVALDFDNCMVGGQIHPEVERVLADTYAEFSPSGTGIRAFFRGQLGNQKSHADGSRYGLELFSSKGYVTFTGNALPATEALGNLNTIAPVDEPVLQMVQARFKRELEARAHEPGEDDPDPVGLTDEQIAQALDALPTELDYDTWVQVGMALHHETRGEGFDIWDAWSQRSPKYTTREYGLERWNSFGRYNGPAVTARTLAKLANEHGAGLQLRSDVASAADFDEAVEAAQSEAPAPTPKAKRFAPVPAAEFADRPAPEWIVKGLLPRAELAVLYGESGAGKSFIATDLAMAIARGEAWRGLRVRQGRVVYVAAEGAGGFRNRLKAYSVERGVDLATLPLDVVSAAPNLLSETKGRGADKVESDTIQLARAIGKADVVIIDTFAQVTPGANENAAEDVGKALAHCKVIHRATGALVVLVHHAGKDASRGARGWSGLKAAADAELEVIRDEELRALRVSKQKEGEDGAVFGFALKQVPIGIDSDEDLITSCVVEPVEFGPGKGVRQRRKLGDVEKIVVAVISEIAESQTAGIELGPVIKEAAKRLPAPEDGKRDTRQQRIRRALVALCNGDDAPYYLDAEAGTLEVV